MSRLSVARAVIAAVVLLFATNSSAHFTTVINAPPQHIPDSIGSHTQLNVTGPVTVYGEFNAGAYSTPGYDIEVNLSGGTFLDYFDTYDGSVLNMSGGDIQGVLRAASGSLINITGGKLKRISLNSGSELNVTQGHIGLLSASSGSVTSIAGGTFSSCFRAYEGSDVSLTGGDFLINGSPPTSTTVTLDSSDILSGTLEDGSPFIFTPLRYDNLNGVKLVAVPLPLIDTTPLDVATTVPLNGLRLGQTLNLNLGGILDDDFAVIGATLNVQGGVLGDSAEFLESTLNITSGEVGESAGVLPGSVVNISGGTVGRFFSASSNTVVNITGGTIGESFRAGSSSIAGESIQVSISGGTLTGRFSAHDGAELEISGGTFGYQFFADSGSTVNITGGSFGGTCGGCGNTFTANSGSVATVSGGAFGHRFAAKEGSIVNISGGLFGKGFDALPGSDVTISGGEFMLNGSSLENTTVTLSNTDMLTGTLQDGTSFIFSRWTADDLSGVKLVNITLPPIDTAPIVVNSDTAPTSLRQGQSLSVLEGGVLANYFSAVGANVNIVGGTVGHSSEFADSVVNIAGGNLGNNVTALQGTHMNISGGEIGRYFSAMPGSVVNVTGGNIESFSSLNGSIANIFGGTIGGGQFGDGSTVNIYGGTLGSGIRVVAGANVHISGGEFGSQFDLDGSCKVAISGGSFGSGFEVGRSGFAAISGGVFGRNFHADHRGIIRLLGGEFLLNNTPYTGSRLTLTDSDVLTGTLEDGSPFIFSWQVNDYFFDAQLFHTSVPVADATPITVSDNLSPRGLRQGQSLTLVEGGVLGDYFSSIGASLNIAGGTVGKGLEVAYSQVSISGGEIGDHFDIFQGSVAEISGGRIGNSFSANAGSEVIISGGEFGDAFTANTESEVMISGGTFGSSFIALSNSEVNFYGTDFLLDGTPLQDLVLGHISDILDRNVTLSGVLADGSPFSFYLDSLNLHAGHYFDSAAVLTVSLVLPGDFDFDGDVDGSDFLLWQRDARDSMDLATWKENYGGSLQPPVSLNGAVPEPSSSALFFIATVALALQTKVRNSGNSCFRRVGICNVQIFRH